MKGVTKLWETLRGQDVFLLVDGGTFSRQRHLNFSMSTYDGQTFRLSVFEVGLGEGRGCRHSAGLQRGPYPMKREDIWVVYGPYMGHIWVVYGSYMGRIRCGQYMGIIWVQVQYMGHIYMGGPDPYTYTNLATTTTPHTNITAAPSPDS